MTTEDLQTKVEAFKQLTAFIKEQNPEITEVQWRINEVPYHVFKNFIENINSTTPDASELKERRFGEKMYCIVKPGYLNKGCEITLWTKPVEIKTIYEVIEYPIEPEQLQEAS